MGLLLVAPPLPQETPGTPAERRRAVESGLLPPSLNDGDDGPGWTIAERMREYGVPGVGVAVVRDGVIEWAAGYGVMEAGGVDPVTGATLFQAASISKPITALAVLALVDRGQLDLDRDVADYLTSWRLPTGSQTPDRRVTLRHLLSHTAGINVHGFPGYRAGSPGPSVVDVLEGRAGGESVRVEAPPGEAFRYSGGGYLVAQVVLEDVAGQDFPSLVRGAVFDPLGMASSRYSPIPDSVAPSVARGHDSAGVPIPGGWFEETALAAGGLWTTPSDLARLAMGISTAWRGEPGAILTPETTLEMFTPGLGGWGLGVPVAGSGDSLSFGHGGNNPGYAAFMVAYPATGDGVVVMTNGTDGGALAMEIVRGAATVYGWEEYQPEVTTSFLRRAWSTITFVGGMGIAGLIFMGWKWTRRPKEEE